MNALVGTRLGPIRRVAPQGLPPTMPDGLRLVVAELADTALFATALGHRLTAGCAWWDERAARAAAVAEAAERYCATLVRGPLLRASYAELRARGRCAVDPGTLALYSPAQHATPGFPFARFTGRTTVLWTAGRRVGEGTSVLVPAAVTYLGWPTDGTMGGRPTNFPISAGIAAGSTFDRAVHAAALEVIERDTVARAWLAPSAGWPVLAAPPGWDAALQGAHGTLHTTLHLVPGDPSLPVVAAVVRDRATGFLALGSACRRDAWDAARKAVAEAVQLHEALHQLDDPASELWRQLDGTDTPLQAWRADRRYAGSYRPDLHDVIDALCHLQLALDPDVRRTIEDHLTGGPAVRWPDPVPADPLEALRDKDLDVIAVDLTTPDVRACGLHVARVVVPGLRPTAPAAFPFLGAAPPALSWAAPDPTDPCLRIPLPHA